MTELACKIIQTGAVNYYQLPTNLRREIADKVPPHIIEQGLKKIFSFLGAGPKRALHYVLIC